MIGNTINDAVVSELGEEIVRAVNLDVANYPEILTALISVLGFVVDSIQCPGCRAIAAQTILTAAQKIVAQYEPAGHGHAH
jgi:hypothetical protein